MLNILIMKRYYKNQRRPETILATIDASRKRIAWELGSLGIIGTIGFIVVLCILGN